MCVCLSWVIRDSDRELLMLLCYFLRILSISRWQRGTSCRNTLNKVSCFKGANWDTHRLFKVFQEHQFPSFSLYGSCSLIDVIFLDRLLTSSHIRAVLTHSSLFSAAASSYFYQNSSKNPSACYLSSITPETDTVRDELLNEAEHLIS